ncbi:MAG: N-acetylmuramoyl-L-alanine amidase [Actinobacteria bacterium]|nr:N-acetylmuramoyl-L-alanine amidase [Actinomycetota bacterium]
MPAGTEPAAPTSTGPRPDVPSPNGSLAGLVVVVDPGHNGANGAHPAEINRPVDAGGFTKACNTTGTEGDGYPESRFNWETSQRLAAALEARGAKVVLTRTSDDGWGPCVDQRGLTAQREGAALIVSIHADGAAASASGFHVIHAAAGPAVTADVATRSTELATTVRDQLAAAGLQPATYLGGGTGMVARTDIATLNRAGVPGVMVECGNMRNAQDLARLRSEAGQQQIADAITAAVAQRYGAR